MSYLLFMDESGHDRKLCPYEVRGGIALHARDVWPFVQAMRELEREMFGDVLVRYGSEIKGARLLDKKRFEWAQQAEPIADEERRRLSVSFLNKGVTKRRPTKLEFTAFGQASLGMVEGIFALLHKHKATIFAAAIPRAVKAPPELAGQGLLRKDHVFLFERYYYFLEQQKEQGLLVLDETDKNLDRQFVREMTRYFTRTEKGRSRTDWLVPSPFFVSSDMTYPVQVADVCVYCINWGFRGPHGMDAPARPEVESLCGQDLEQLQLKRTIWQSGRLVPTCGIVYVPDPYTPRARPGDEPVQEKRR